MSELARRGHLRVGNRRPGAWQVRSVGLGGGEESEGWRCGSLRNGARTLSQGDLVLEAQESHLGKGERWGGGGILCGR